MRLKNCIGKVDVKEVQDVSGTHYATISFKLSYKSWRRLKKKKYWEKVVEFINRNSVSEYGKRITALELRE